MKAQGKECVSAAKTENKRKAKLVLNFSGCSKKDGKDGKEGKDADYSPIATDEKPQAIDYQF